MCVFVEFNMQLNPSVGSSADDRQSALLDRK